MSGALLHNLLLGQASLSLSAAVTSMASLRASDAFELGRALHLVSASLPDEVTPTFRTELESQRASIESALIDESSIYIAGKTLGSLLATLGEESWQGVVRRFGTAKEASAILTSPGPYRWVPRVTVEGEDPAQVRFFEFMITSMIRHLVGVSVVNSEKNSEWRRGLVASGLLETRSVHVQVSPLDDQSDIGLQAKWGLSREGSPLVTLAHRKDLRCTIDMLAYAILRSCRSAGHPKVSLGADLLTHKNRPAPAIKNALQIIHWMMWPRESVAYVEKLADIQEELLAGTGHARIRGAFAGLTLPKSMKVYLAKKLDTVPIRLAVEPLEGNRSGHVAFQWRPAEKYAALGNWKREGTLFLHVGWNLRYLALSSPEEMWTALARAFALWVSEGEPRTESEPTKKTRLPFPVGDPNRENSARSILLQPAMVPLSSEPEIANDLIEEYHALFHWLPDTQGEFFFRTNALKEIAQVLDDNDFLDLRRYHFPLTKVRWIDQPDPETTLSMDRESAIHQTWEATIRGQFSRFQAIDPMDFLERLADLARRYESRYAPTKTYKPTQLFRPLTDKSLSDLWAWLRLFRRYEKLTAPAGPTGFQLLGGSAKALAPEIAASLQKINLTDPLKVQASLSAHGVWITDSARTEIQMRSNEFQMTRKAARRATVLAAPRAKLLHFDGEPRFDREAWDLIVRVSLDAPPGLTWFEPDWPWNTNRPALTVEEGDDGWYALNPQYAQSTAQERAAYRWAIGHVRKRLKEQGQPALEPQTTWPDYRRAFQKLMMAYHPDRRGTAEDKSGAFQNLKKAFDILAKFYKES